MTRDIRGLVIHLEEQMAHKDAREPGCLWIAGELKKYLEAKDEIVDTVLSATVCEWCLEPRKGRQAVHMEGFGAFPVCEICFDHYVKAEFKKLESRIGKIHKKQKKNAKIEDSNERFKFKG